MHRDDAICLHYHMEGFPIVLAIESSSLKTQKLELLG